MCSSSPPSSSHGCASGKSGVDRKEKLSCHNALLQLRCYKSQPKTPSRCIQRIAGFNARFEVERFAGTCFINGSLKAPGFSRAATSRINTWALAPEGTTPAPLNPVYETSSRKFLPVDQSSKVHFRLGAEIPSREACSSLSALHAPCSKSLP